MSNTNSVQEKNGRYVNGGTTELNSTKLEWWERKKLGTNFEGDSTYVLEKIYEHRPEKLAAVLYNDSRLWWAILQYNSILDIDEEFVEGRVLIIPTKEKIQLKILNSKIGGVKSTRQERTS